MSNHTTPGPWEVEDEINVYASGSCICTAYAQQPEARAYAIDEIDDEGRANARLIAAAPEMLQTLHEIIASLDGYVGIDFGPKSWRAQTIDRCAAAIGKAERS